jgi:phenylalanyl-tRNA synthetase beta chain
LHTDSSHRFERGVDPELPRKALERATALLLDIVGGHAGPITEAVHKKHLPAHKPIKLRADRLQQILGVAIPKNDITKILGKLGFQVTASGQASWKVIAPSYRFDMAIEVDLIEEIARIYGYDRIPNTLPTAQLAIKRRTGQTHKEHQVRQLLADRGYHEAITYSFVDSRLQRLLDPVEEAIALANPISVDMAVMRTNLWPGLLQAVINNHNRQQKRIRLYELGIRFITRGKKVKEEKVIAGVAMGSLYPEQWGTGQRQVDFYDLKGDIEALLDLTGMPGEFVFEPGGHAALHPGQSARIMYHDRQVGCLGMLHPAVSKELGLEGDIQAFELQFSALEKGKIPVFHELSKYPAIRRDIAVIVDDTIPSKIVRECVEKTAGELLQQLQLFDVYSGKGVDSGRKSLALGLTLQEFSRTLNDTEIDTLIERVLAELTNKLGATLRE